MRNSILHLLCLAVCAMAQNEPYRPAFHFTPEKNWMNDPNGMVFYEGEWHLFYQYNPKGNTWGHMSWGHAVSRDLVRWEHLPLALAEEDGVMIFSGSAVVDWKNTSGFGKDGKPPLIAIYTGHRQGRQDQRIAYSNDRGRTWTKFQGNPVLDVKMADFRDPKVFWHEPTSHWVMTVALAAEKKVHFYTSPDLKQWKYSAEFGPAGVTAGLWECPDLFPVNIEGDGPKWVLIVNINPGGPAGGSGCQYFTGAFDGSRFIPDPLPAPITEIVPKGKVIADFENGYGDWKVDGEAFGTAPASGTLPNQQPVEGFRGRGFANSMNKGDASQGTLTSPQFEITANHISFLIGGGAHDETRVDLRIEDKVVRTAKGRESERLAWQSWDVKDLKGKRAEIQVVDKHTGGWGHINLDHIVLADEAARPASETTLWADYGADFYAGVSWSDVPKTDGRRIWLGWMSNWQYAEKVPTDPWRSAMSVPRTLSLRKTPTGLRLVQQPVAELLKLRAPSPRKFAGGSFTDAIFWLQEQRNLPVLLDAEVTFTNVTAKSGFTLQLHTAPDEAVAITFDGTKSRLSLDRSRSGKIDFHPKFPARHDAPIRIIDGRVTLRVLVDTSSIEVFAQNGETVLTDLFFPTDVTRQFSLSNDGQYLRVGEILIHEVAPKGQAR